MKAVLLTFTTEATDLALPQPLPAETLTMPRELRLIWASGNMNFFEEAFLCRHSQQKWLFLIGM